MKLSARKENINNEIEHLDNVRQDLRDELKMRITQRDNFAIQYIIVIGGSSLGAVNYTYFIFLLLPFISIYFTIQILYSYHIHDMICYFLRERIEKRISELTKGCILNEWENFTSNNRKISSHTALGIRRNFFVYCMWFVTIITYLLFFTIYLIPNNNFDLFIMLIFGGSLFIYVTLNIYITYKFVFQSKKRKFE